MTLQQYILDNFDGVLESIMARVRKYEKWLGPEDDFIEDDRRIIFERLDELGGHPFTRKKGRDDYICRADAESDAVEEALYESGYQRNLASTRKYRVHEEWGKQWAVGSWVLDPKDTGWQHHVYLFERKESGTDVYGHWETSVREGSEHVTETNQRHGDPKGKAREALENADIEFEV